MRAKEDSANDSLLVVFVEDLSIKFSAAFAFEGIEMGGGKVEVIGEKIAILEIYFLGVAQEDGEFDPSSLSIAGFDDERAVVVEVDLIRPRWGGRDLDLALWKRPSEGGIASNRRFFGGLFSRIFRDDLAAFRDDLAALGDALAAVWGFFFL